VRRAAAVEGRRPVDGPPARREPRHGVGARRIRLMSKRDEIDDGALASCLAEELRLPDGRWGRCKEKRPHECLVGAIARRARA